VNLKDTWHQTSRQLELAFCDRGEPTDVGESGEVSSAARENERSGNSVTQHEEGAVARDDARLMERIVASDNVVKALKRVQKNKGSPGTDGMTVEELRNYLRENWRALREQLLTGTYRPRPVKRQIIPKRDGGERELGIPTAIDRFIQQAILQVLQPQFDPTFSPHSHGFRPGRSAHDAVCEAQKYIREGKTWVVDADLEKFFDCVNHDVLMGRLAKRIADKRVLRLIRNYLDAGVMANGIVKERHAGTPQGGPLSPLLANVLLDEVDKELEKRGHAFVRYADDLNVYVRTKRAGERVMETLKRLYANLKLRINESKSAVARPWDRKLLGYSFWVAKDKSIVRRVADEALKAMKDRVRSMTKRHGRSLKAIVTDLRSYLIGWKNYFRLSEMPSYFRELDAWIRHRLRAIQLKQWRRRNTIYRNLLQRGTFSSRAWLLARDSGWWRRSESGVFNRAIPVSYFDGLGLPRLAI
jgi:RNA-directed DNA polymerase